MPSIFNDFELLDFINLDEMMWEGGNIELAVADSYHEHVAGGVALTQEHSLAANSSAHRLSGTLEPVTESGAIVTESGATVYAEGPIAITQDHFLSVEGTAHEHSAGTVALTQGHILSVGSAYNDVVSVGISLTQDHFLSVAGTAHQHSAGAVALTQEHALSVTNAWGETVSGNVTLIQKFDLSVAGAHHVFPSDNISLTQEHDIAVGSAYHEHAVGAVALAFLNQEGFRFRNDDGDEDEATWRASQDVSIMLPAESIARVRFLIDSVGDIPGKQFQLEYRYKPSGGAFGNWSAVQ